MIKADIAKLAWALSSLREYQKIGADRQAVTNQAVIDDQYRNMIRTGFGIIRERFLAFGMPVTLDRISIAEMHLQVDVITYKHVETDCDEISNCAQSELKRIYFGYISPAKQDELLQAKTLWQSTILAFNDAEKDAEMASRCYALECNDACVYHSMMVLEHGMLALAKKLGVKGAGSRAWQTIIEDIEREIEKRQKTLRAKKPSDFLTFLSEAAKEFRYFKDAWRNHTAHGRADYDENDARKVLIHVRDFMEHISTRLKELGR